MKTEREKSDKLIAWLVKSTEASIISSINKIGIS